MASRDQLAVWGSLLLFAVLSGSAFLFTHTASETIPPFTLVALRMGLGFLGLASLSVAFYRKEIGPLLTDPHFLRTSVMMGFFNNFLPYSLYPYAFYFGVDVGVSSISTGLTPLFSLVFAPIMLPKVSSSPCQLRNLIGKIWSHPLTCLSLTGTGMSLGILGMVIISVGQISEPNFDPIVFVGYAMLLVYAASKGVDLLSSHKVEKSLTHFGIGKLSRVFTGTCMLSDTTLSS